MRKLWKRLCVLLSAIVLLAALAACGGNGDNGEAIELLIYVESADQLPSESSRVLDLLEEKFKEDTGISINLNYNLYATDDLNTKVGLALTGQTAFDGLLLHYGDDTGINVYIRDNFALELDELLEVHGQNILAKIPSSQMSTYKMDGNIYAIPSYRNDQYGLLVRKDWREEAELEKPETIEQFTAMLEAFQRRGSNMVPMVGPPWDVERALAGSFETYPYFSYVFDDQDNLLPGFVHKNRGPFLSQLYDWSNRRLWDPDNQNRQIDSVQSLMVTERAGVYCYTPTAANLVRVARMVQVENPDAEFEVITSLTGPSGETSGFYDAGAANTGLMIPKSSKNAVTMVKYLNWLYGDVENYELAAYGVEGEHWVKDGDDKYGYPKAKELQYIERPPIHWSLTLLPNENISDRLLNYYTADEQAWAAQIKGVKIFADSIRGYMLPSINDSVLASPFHAQGMRIMTEICAYAWAGNTDPMSLMEESTQTRMEYYTGEFTTKAAGYIDLLSNGFKRMLAEEQ